MKFQQPGLIDAVERDLANRYDHALRRSLFPEVRKTDGFQLLAQELVEGKFSEVSPGLRRRILLRAARSTAVRSEIETSERFLSAAQAMPGEDSDLPARARLAEAKGDIDGAIHLLRDQEDADCRSTLLNILFKNRGNDAGLEWLNQSGSSVADLTANGVHTLVVTFLQQHDVEKAREVLAAATASQFLDGPFLLFLRAAVRLACLLSKPDQGLALQGQLPLDVKSASVVAPDDVAAEELDVAISDLTRLLPVALELGLSEARRIAEAYIVWCKLLHPHRRPNALMQLRADMAEPKTALRQLQFAFAYDSEFDPAPVAPYLEN